ncbi:hypothetical protein BCR32DRAFT_213809, partial [Anaeromyces robustus]
KIITINSNNQTSIHFCNNETITSKSKRIQVRIDMVKELVQGNLISLKYIKSMDYIADRFTKYLNRTLLTTFRNKILTKF